MVGSDAVIEVEAVVEAEAGVGSDAVVEVEARVAAETCRLFPSKLFNGIILTFGFSHVVFCIARVTFYFG